MWWCYRTVWVLWKVRPVPISETCVTCDVDGTEEVSINFEDAIDIKEEVSFKVEEAIDIKMKYQKLYHFRQSRLNMR